MPSLEIPSLAGLRLCDAAASVGMRAPDAEKYKREEEEKKARMKAQRGAPAAEKPRQSYQSIVSKYQNIFEQYNVPILFDGEAPVSANAIMMMELWRPPQMPAQNVGGYTFGFLDSTDGSQAVVKVCDRSDPMGRAFQALVQSSTADVKAQSNWAEGTFNVYFKFGDSSAMMGIARDVIRSAYGTSDAAVQSGAAIGMRRTKGEVLNYETGMAALQELCHMHAAFSKGIGVRVFAAHCGPRITFLLENAVPLKRYLGIYGEEDTSVKLESGGKDPLLTALLKAAELKMIMTDIKFDNIVVSKRPGEEFGSVKFIDLGGDYTTIRPSATTDCVFFINAALLVASSACSYIRKGKLFQMPTRSYPSMYIFYTKEFLQPLLNETRYLLDKAVADPRTLGEQLCLSLLNVPQRTPEEYMPKPTFGRQKFKLTEVTDDEFAVHIMAMAYWYSKVLDTSKTKCKYGTNDPHSAAAGLIRLLEHCLDRFDYEAFPLPPPS
jgi:hypothetical protein